MDWWKKGMKDGWMEGRKEWKKGMKEWKKEGKMKGRNEEQMEKGN